MVLYTSTCAQSHTTTMAYEETSMSTTDICFMTATELARRIRAKELSARAVMEAHLTQIERVNPTVNAIVTLLPEHALAGARAADEALAHGAAVGPLHGLPIAHKDLFLTKGIRTTYGSRIYADFVPDQDMLIVERMRHAGAITIGKTNTPEFGAGSQTFNDVFGATLNPYDLTKTCGGSSGGAAVALACGMVPLADGSDLGGSLRNPASFCNVVGFRPSPGRVPTWPTSLAWNTLSVEGPMARSAQEVAFLLAVMAGPDPRAPISIDEPGAVSRRPLKCDLKGARVAWSRNLGKYPVQPLVNQVCDKARQIFLDLGCHVEDAEPDFSDANEAFQVLRGWTY